MPGDHGGVSGAILRRAGQQLDVDHIRPEDWSSGTTGLGFGVMQPGFAVTYIVANTYVDDLDVCRQVLVDPSLQREVVNTDGAGDQLSRHGGRCSLRGRPAVPHAGDRTGLR